MTEQFAPRKVIAVDVDGTLLVNGKLNEKVAAWCKNQRSRGFQLILWSARGEDYALNIARIGNVSDLFDHIISKPSVILDDHGWGWIKFTKVVRSLGDIF